MLSALGTALGSDIIGDTHDDSTTITSRFGLWPAITLIVSFALGGFVAGKLARLNGLTHGFLVWASVLICGVILGNLTVNSPLSAATNAIGSALLKNSAINSTVIAPLGESGTKLINRIADDLSANMNLNFEVDQNNAVKQLLSATGIPVMQADFIRDQIENARDDANRALEELYIHPDNYITILSGLIARFDQRTNAISEDIDQDAAIRGLMRNTGMSEDEARVNMIRLLAAHQQATNLAQDVLGEAEGRLRAAQLEIDDRVQDAQDAADAASYAITHSALAAFFTLLLGAILCSYAGYFGAIRRSSWLERKKTITSKDDPS